ncbi:MAG: heavy-metal-associated domain-containing protein [Candidatus Zixiibacteriota bacterium]|nr:MAG: heavy-metal-associated domain-containing protein [candidate division Zixibacteria bacterium]
MKKIAIFGFAVLTAFALLIYPNFATACGGSSSGAKMGDAGATKATMAGSTRGANVETADSYTMGKMCPVDKTAKSASQEDNVAMVTLAVKGMTCGGCEGQVRQALSAQKGVAEVVQVCHKSDVAVLKYDPNVVGPSEMVSVVNKAGYEAEIKPAVNEMSGEEMKKVSEKKSVEM